MKIIKEYFDGTTFDKTLTWYWLALLCGVFSYLVGLIVALIIPLTIFDGIILNLCFNFFGVGGLLFLFNLEFIVKPISKRRFKIQNREI